MLTARQIIAVIKMEEAIARGGGPTREFAGGRCIGPPPRGRMAPMAKKTDHKDDPRNPGSGEPLEAKVDEATEASLETQEAPPDTEQPPPPPTPPEPALAAHHAQLNAPDEPIRHQQAAERLEIEAANAMNVRNFAEHKAKMLQAVAEWKLAGIADKAAIAQKVADAGG